MFLTENVRYGTPAVDANPSTGWRMLYESEVAWGKLVMGMTRLEHDAIVNEDSRLLSEGVSEFGKKVKRWFQWAGQEFLRYIDKVLDTWTNLSNKIRTWNFDLEAMKKKLSNGEYGKDGKKTMKISKKHKAYIEFGMQVAAKSESIRREIDKIADAADQHYKDDKSSAFTGLDAWDTQTDASKSKGGTVTKAAVGIFAQAGIPAKFFTAIYGDAANASGNYDDQDSFSASDLTMAANFIKDGRTRCIKTLQAVRNSFAKIINRGIKASDNESEDVKQIKRASSRMREAINAFISGINKATNACMAELRKLSGTATKGTAASVSNKFITSYYFD